jgi:hypothetical protein
LSGKNSALSSLTFRVMCRHHWESRRQRKRSSLPKRGWFMSPHYWIVVYTEETCILQLQSAETHTQPDNDNCGIFCTDDKPLSWALPPVKGVFSMAQRHILQDRRPSTAACPACWAMGTKEVKKCTSTVRKKYFVLGRLEQPGQNKNLLYRHDEPNKPTKEGPLSFVLCKYPFTSVSTVSMGHLSL